MSNKNLLNYKIKQMKSLSELTAKIREWNLMGFSLLPNLQFVIIHNQKFNTQIIQFLNDLQCQELFYHQQSVQNKTQNKLKQKQLITLTNQPDIQIQHHNKKEITQQSKCIEMQIQNINKLIVNQDNQLLKHQKACQQLVKWDNRLQNKIYAIYLLYKNVEARVHLIIDQDVNGQISDQNFKKIKKILQKLKRNKNLIFLNFNTTVYKLDAMFQHIQQFGLSYRSKQRQIKIDQNFFLNAYNKEFRNDTQISQVKCRKQYPSNKKIDKNNNKPQKKQKQQQSKQPQLQPTQQNFLLQSHLHYNKYSSLVKQKLQQKFNFKSNINIVQILSRQIQKKYVSVFGVQINRNYTEMRLYHKELKLALKQYIKIQELLKKSRETYQAQHGYRFNQKKHNGLQNKRENNNYLTKYALNCLYQSKEYLTANFTGTYSTLQVQQLSLQKKFNNYKYHHKIKRNGFFQHKKSIHWEVMEIINNMWEIQGDSLMKQIQRMPLSYIQQRYKMLDYQTIGGFMPSSCFQAIFSAPLVKTLNQIMASLQMMQAKIIYEIKTTIQYFFNKLNICYDISDRYCCNIKNICQTFIKQTSKVLKSQIQYISTSSQDYWSYKQIKSNLYSPQQQIYIEIKYIGKNYIKKVWENIKQTLPRLIGQNLLKQITLYFQNQSLNSLIQVLRQIPVEIQINKNQLKYLEECKSKQKIINNLVYFFSLRTNSQTSIKNLNEKIQQNWKRMYKLKEKNDFQTYITQNQSQQKGGFIKWALNLLKGNKNKKTKRSLSQERNDNNKENKEDKQQNKVTSQKFQSKKHAILSQKNWLLIINIDKDVETQKIQKSSEQGFPQRLRPAIWHYLAKKQNDKKIQKIQTLLNRVLTFSSEQKKQVEEIYKQIQKDVLRTPPPTLFRQGHLKQSLTRVLRAYSIYDKQLRYTQGMNFIVGIILCVLTHHGINCQYSQQNIKSKSYYDSIEQKAFQIFVCMMQKKGLRKIMLIQRATITDLCIRLQRYIRQKSIIMSDKIQRSGFTIEMIFSGALISGLTTSGIDFNIQRRVIDILITYDFVILYKVIGQFVASSQIVCQNMENQNLYFFLKDKFYNEVFKLIGEQGLTRMFRNL